MDWVGIFQLHNLSLFPPFLLLLLLLLPLWITLFVLRLFRSLYTSVTWSSSALTEWIKSISSTCFATLKLDPNYPKLRFEWFQFLLSTTAVLISDNMNSVKVLSHPPQTRECSQEKGNNLHPRMPPLLVKASTPAVPCSLSCWDIMFPAKQGKCTVLLCWCRTSASICSAAPDERSDWHGCRWWWVGFGGGATC